MSDFKSKCKILYQYYLEKCARKYHKINERKLDEHLPFLRRANSTKVRAAMEFKTVVLPQMNIMRSYQEMRKKERSKQRIRGEKERRSGSSND